MTSTPTFHCVTTAFGTETSSALCWTDMSWLPLEPVGSDIVYHSTGNVARSTFVETVGS